jgi:hypothetical protein
LGRHVRGNLWAAACGFLATLQKRNALNNRPAEINPGRA